MLLCLLSLKPTWQFQHLLLRLFYCFFLSKKFLNLTFQLFWREAADGKFCLHRHLEHCRDVVEQSLLLQDMSLEI